jgi:hypothetical protein
MEENKEEKNKQVYLDHYIQRLANHYHVGKIIRLPESRTYTKVLAFNSPAKKLTWSTFDVEIIHCDMFGVPVAGATPTFHCKDPWFTDPNEKE